MMTEASEPAPRTTTVWQQLEEWALGLLPWQRFVLSEAVRSGPLKDDKIDHVYGAFLGQCDLGERKALSMPGSISGRPTTTTGNDIQLTSIQDLHAVNALPHDAKLTFGPELTIVYGANGVGKSGFTRILSNVCFSRTQHKILHNVYNEERQERLQATIWTKDRTGAEQEFVFDGTNENVELKRLSVFDTATARIHLVEQKPLGFTPAGFDVFPEMARVYGNLLERLNSDIASRTRDDKFHNAFVAPPSIVSDAVTKLSPDTNLDELRSMASFGDSEVARLDELQQQRTDLETKSSQNTAQQLEVARLDVTKVIEALDKANRALGEESLNKYGRVLATYRVKSEAVKALGTETFRHEKLSMIGTDSWEGFIRAAHHVATREHESYPRAGDHCILCQQLLSEASQELLHRLWAFLLGDAKMSQENALNSVDEYAMEVKSCNLKFFDPDTAAYSSVSRLNPELAKSIARAIERLEIHRDLVLRALLRREDEVPFMSHEDQSGGLLILRDRIDGDLARMRDPEPARAMNAVEAERIALRHRQVLSQLFPEIEKYVVDLKWIRAASSAKSALSPRSLTAKESELFSTVIAEDYRRILAAECSSLRCDMPVEFRTQGQRGQTLKSITIRGNYSPEAILSEGEQRAVALADFLTEVSLNPTSAGIVLDDPVTSMDHVRKGLIAKRLVNEAKNRQVIVFTHDLVFLALLAEQADQRVEMVTHWMERGSSGEPGQVSLNDCPTSVRQYRTTAVAAKTLEEAKKAAGAERLRLVQRGMAELRRTVEEIVAQSLFKEVVSRWSDRVIVTKLKKINWDNALADEIVRSFEELSGHMEGHSHTDERGAPPPEPSELERLISTINELAKMAKRERVVA
jgi:energy-coupling factor transporter ATP-binding protein EcfA2